MVCEYRPRLGDCGGWGGEHEVSEKFSDLYVVNILYPTIPSLNNSEVQEFENITETGGNDGNPHSFSLAMLTSCQITSIHLCQY